MRRKARKNKSRGKMHAQMYTRSEVSTSLLATGRAKSSNNKLKGLRAAPFGPRRWLRPVKVIPSFSARWSAFCVAFPPKGSHFRSCPPILVPFPSLPFLHNCMHVAPHFCTTVHTLSVVLPSIPLPPSFNFLPNGMCFAQHFSTMVRTLVFQGRLSPPLPPSIFCTTVCVLRRISAQRFTL